MGALQTDCIQRLPPRCWMQSGRRSKRPPGEDVYIGSELRGSRAIGAQRVPGANGRRGQDTGGVLVLLSLLEGQVRGMEQPTPCRGTCLGEGRFEEWSSLRPYRWYKKGRSGHFRSTAAKFCRVAILQTLRTEQENPAEPCHYARTKACTVEHLNADANGGLKSPAVRSPVPILKGRLAPRT